MNSQIQLKELFEDLREQIIFQEPGKYYLHASNYFLERAMVPGYESKGLPCSSTDHFLNLKFGIVSKTNIVIVTTL